MNEGLLEHELDPYLSLLRELPFVRGVSAHALSREGGPDAIVVLETTEGKFELMIAITRVHAGYDIAERAVDTLTSPDRQGLLFAPLIGAPLGVWLAERGVGYVDGRGNCDLRLADRYYWHVEGRTTQGAHEAATKGVRAPGFQVIYTLLARPELVDASVREVAEAAGTSRQPVVDVLRRFVADGLLIRTGRGRATEHQWVEHRRVDAFERWAHGYRTAVRPRIAVGRYRLPDRTPDAIEATVARELTAAGVQWRWGGASAAWRVEPWYRSDHVVVHVDALPRTLAARMRALPDREGPLVVLGFPGPASLRGRNPHTVEPLLAYTEMMTQGDEREREAARKLAQRELPWL